MNANIVVSIIIIIVVVFLGFLIFQGGDSNPEVSLEDTTTEESSSSERENKKESQFDKAPGFLLEDINGNEVGLGQFPGKILVLNSWAVWCPFCVDELSDFGALQEEFGEAIVVIAINRQESLQKTARFIDDLGVTDKMLWLMDPTDSFYKSIGGFSMPETLFVDADRNIRIHKRGPMELSEMIEKINSIIDN